MCRSRSWSTAGPMSLLEYPWGIPMPFIIWIEIDDLDLEAIGPAFETHERFPERTNSEFIQVVDRSHLRMRVWERGSWRDVGLRHGSNGKRGGLRLKRQDGNTVEVELKGEPYRLPGTGRAAMCI